MTSTKLILPIALLVAAPLLWAQVPSKTLGGGKAAGKLMTRDELRACLKQQATLKTGRADLKSQQDTLDAEKPALVDAGTALKEELATLDRSSADAVAAYNAKAQANDQKVDAWNQRNAALVEQAKTWQGQNDSWAATCAGRPYDENQELLIRAGK